MKLRRLGASGLSVSEICLGTMMFGERTDEAEATRIVASASTFSRPDFTCIAFDADQASGRAAR